MNKIPERVPGATRLTRAAGQVPIRHWAIAVDIVALALLVTGLVLHWVLGQAAAADVLAPLAVWAPLLAAWWGLSHPRLDARWLGTLALVFLLCLRAGLPPDGFGYERVVVCLLILALTRQWEMRSAAGGQATASFHDAVSGVCSRAYIEAELAHIAAVSNRYQWPFSLMIAQTGAASECVLAGLIAERIRLSDSAGLWDDGRLLILLTNTRLSDALKLAENLKRAIAAARLPGAPTVSFGVAEHDFGSDPMVTVAAAERLLAEAATE